MGHHLVVVVNQLIIQYQSSINQKKPTRNRPQQAPCFVDS